MANYTADAYAGSNLQGVAKAKGANDAKYGFKDPNEGQTSKRVQIKPGSQISGGEIWVNEDTTLAASDTLTITVKEV